MPISTANAAPQPTQDSKAVNFRWPASGRTISIEDHMFFTEQLALLLETGTPLHHSLLSLKKQHPLPAVRHILEEVAAEVEKGVTFSSALSHHPEMFPTSYVKLVEASEGGGFLPRVLTELLNMDEKQQQLKGTITSAAAYPVFLMIFSVAVVIFVMVFVFPKFSAIFDSIRDQLPITTVLLMHISETLREHWLALCALASGFALALFYLGTSPAGRLHLDRAKLRLPLLRDIYQQIYLVQLLRVLSLSLGNGVSVRDALIASREVVNNRCYRELISQAEQCVQQGQRLSDAFSNSPYLPGMAQQMLATGEETGNLAKVMARIADYYEKMLTKRLNQLSKLAEPLMLMIMGLVVGLIVSSLILPIFQLSRVAM